MGWLELLEWQNLVFELPLVAVLLYVIGLAAGAVGHHDADVDAGADSDLHPATEGHEGVAEHGLFTALLSVLGIGRVPVGVVFVSFFTLFGVLGLALNQALAGLSLAPIIYFWGALGGAIAGGVALTNRLTKLVARLMPTTETYVVRREDLCGKVATALFPVTERSGMALVADDSGTLHQIQCRVGRDEAPIAKGVPILLVSYEAETSSFTVCRAPAELTEQLPGLLPGGKGHSP